MKFPKEIYVAVEKSDSRSSDEWLTVVEDAFAGEGETREVALYKRVETGKVVVTRTYQPTAAK